ncbi:hypothetical protein PR048_018217 [Dryococelus australis]|uniref:Uncharacterized protein n=1 Tax=Dryococelus australis TaxID=614101 RepID=A0ABQ9HBP1_9NEOP|nr:hypothetical protein PR048_018217 [Dryococelus australis]
MIPRNPANEENFLAFNQLLSASYVHKKLISEELTPINSQKLSNAKVKALKSVLEFIHPASCRFYGSLILCN